MSTPGEAEALAALARRPSKAPRPSSSMSNCTPKLDCTPIVKLQSASFRKRGSEDFSQASDEDDRPRTCTRVGLRRAARSLRAQTLLVLFLLLVALFVVMAVVIFIVLPASFSALEKNEAREALDRLSWTLLDEIDTVAYMALQFSSWDVPCKLIAEEAADPAAVGKFMDEFYGEGELKHLNLAFVAHYDATGTLRFGTKRVPAELGTLPAGSPLRPDTLNDMRGALYSLALPGAGSATPQLFIVVGTAMRWSNCSGPVVGTLVWGRHVNETLFGEVSRRSQTCFAAEGFGGPPGQADLSDAKRPFLILGATAPALGLGFAGAAASFPPSESRVVRIEPGTPEAEAPLRYCWAAFGDERPQRTEGSSERFAMYVTYGDPYSRPVLSLRLDVARAIVVKGSYTLSVVFGSFAACCATVAAIMLAYVEGVVVRPIARLTAAVRSVVARPHPRRLPSLVAVEPSPTETPGRPPGVDRGLVSLEPSRRWSLRPSERTTRALAERGPRASIPRVGPSSELEFLSRATDRMLAWLLDQKAASERILYEAIPPPIVARLKAGDAAIADAVPSATCVFADICGFTSMCASLDPAALLAVLDLVFTRLDARIERRAGVEKIKNIGDAVMVCAGLHVQGEAPGAASHAADAVELALDFLDEIEEINATCGRQLTLRIGVCSGPMIAGVIGRKKLIFDVWGDSVNVASRFEQLAEPGTVALAEATVAALGTAAYPLEPLGPQPVKGKGDMRAWRLRPRREWARPHARLPGEPSPARGPLSFVHVTPASPPAPRVAPGSLESTAALRPRAAD